MPEPNFYYGFPPHRSDRIQTLFERIAPRYDRLNDLMSLGMHRLWKRRLIDLAAPTKKDRAIDLCCGSGDVALRMAQSGARVIGVDFSKKMLDIARCRSRAMPNLRFVNANVIRLPFKKNAFDLATIAYGLRNVTDWNAALVEFLRILKPAGRLYILDFGKPENPLWRKLFLAYLRSLVPVLGRIFCGDFAAYAYILESLDAYPPQKNVMRKMASLSMQDIAVQSIWGGAMNIHSGRKSKF